MKKIRFEKDQKRDLLELRKKLGPVSKENMIKIIVQGCGGICYETCSYYCRDEVGSIITSIHEPH